MLDRRKLAAPVFAQAAAFVVVLLIGELAGSHAKSQPTPSPSPTPRASASAAHSSPGISTTPAALSKLTVEVAEEAGATSGVPVAGIQVQVLQDRKNGAVVASGILSPVGAQGTSFDWAQRVAAGSYQVCLLAPTATKFVGVNTDMLSGWFCSLVSVGPGSAPVTFILAAKAGK